MKERSVVVYDGREKFFNAAFALNDVEIKRIEELENGKRYFFESNAGKIKEILKDVACEMEKEKNGIGVPVISFRTYCDKKKMNRAIGDSSCFQILKRDFELFMSRGTK